MQEVTLSEQHVELSTKMDFVISELKDIKEVLHERVNRTNERVDKTNEHVEELEKQVAGLEGGIKALWGVLIIFSALASGVIIKLL